VNPKLKSVFSNAFRFLRLGRRPKPLDSPAKPLELPARWRHYEDERGIHVEACDENGVTKAVLRIREVGINRQQLIINAEHLKKSGYSEKAANLLRLAARRLAAETSRPNAVVTIGKESWLEGKKKTKLV